MNLERFQAKWIPVRVKKTRQNKNLEPRSDSIGTETALAQRNSTTAEAGFTLVEMLVVLAILSVVMTFAGPLLSGGSQGVRLQTAVNELVSAFRLTRSAAIARNAETSLMVDVDKRTFRSTVVSPRPFAPEIEAKVKFAAGVGTARSDGSFRFFPDGSSTGGDVTLVLRGKQARLCIDWLTGEVRRDSAC